MLCQLLIGSLSVFVGTDRHRHIDTQTDTHKQTLKQYPFAYYSCRTDDKCVNYIFAFFGVIMIIKVPIVHKFWHDFAKQSLQCKENKNVSCCEPCNKFAVAFSRCLTSQQCLTRLTKSLCFAASRKRGRGTVCHHRSWPPPRY